MRKVILVALLLVTPGCNWFHKDHPRMAEVWPTYQIPAQPRLDIPTTVTPGKSPELDSLIRNLYNTIQYCETLKVIVNTHNSAAKAHNQAVETGLGVGK
jgi:hypothetical protein